MVAGKDLLIGRLNIVYLHKVDIPRLLIGCFVLQKHHLHLPQALAALQYEVVIVHVIGTEILPPAEHLISIGSGLIANQSDTDISTPVLASIRLTASQDTHTIVVVTSCNERRVILFLMNLKQFLWIPFM